LKDKRFLGQRRRSQNSAVAGDFAPPEDAHSEVFRDGLECRLAVRSELGIGAEEDVADCILSRRWEFEVLIGFKLSLHECMRD